MRFSCLKASICLPVLVNDPKEIEENIQKQKLFDDL